MNATTKKLTGMAVTAVAVLAVALIAAPAALAQEPADPPAPGTGWMADYSQEVHQAAADALGITLEEFYAALGEGQTVYDLAEEQGVDVADVWAAMDAARADVLADLVDEGVITQAQADWALSRMQGARALGFNRAARGTMMGYGAGVHQDVLEQLGLDPAEVYERLAAGETLAEIAESEGIDLDDLYEARRTAIAEQLDAMVADGLLTQAQADAALERIEDCPCGLGAGVGVGPGMGPGMGMMQGQGIGRGGRFGAAARGWMRGFQAGSGSN